MNIELIGFLLDERDLIKGYMSKNAIYEYWEERITILNFVSNMEDIDLLITANNFIIITPNKIEESIANYLNDFLVICDQKISNKKPLIIGGDIYHSHISFNPYYGIDSFCCFLNPLNSKFDIGTYIWESWADGECNSNAFLIQNPNRMVSIEGKRICLLSCGDIMSTCHCKGKLLPDADIYVSIAHLNFSKWLLEDKKSDFETHIHRWKQNNDLYIFVTQNLTYSEAGKGYYFNGLEYQLIWPNSCRQQATTLLFDARNHSVTDFKDAKYFTVKLNI